MAPQQLRFAHNPRRLDDGRAPDELDGAWWPISRRLEDQLKNLFDAWPPGQPRIDRVLYSPPDWEDRPRKVAVGGGRLVKTGNFPQDDTHLLTLTLSDRTRQKIGVIDPETSPEVAARILDSLTPAAPA